MRIPDDAVLNVLFLEARTDRTWLQTVDNATRRRVHELARWPSDIGQFAAELPSRTFRDCAREFSSSGGVMAAMRERR